MSRQHQADQTDHTRAALAGGDVQLDLDQEIDTLTSDNDDELRSIELGRSAPRRNHAETSLGPYYDDNHRRPFRQRGGFARWYGNHGRTGDVEQWLRRGRVPAALAASGFSINGAAKIVGCSWHTLYNDMHVILGSELPPKFLRWLRKDSLKMEVIELRQAGKTFRHISERTGVPLSTCHRWWHHEMGE